MTVGEILEAIRGLPRADRLWLAEQLSRELVEPPSERREKLGAYMEKRGRLLVYTGPLPDAAFDRRNDRD
jgi:hypothetical protein